MSVVIPAPSNSPSPKSQSKGAPPEVAVLGAAAVDWIARVDAMPPLDGIAFAEQYAPFVGGAAANVAEGVARLGHSVRFLGAVGGDEEGRMLLQAFKAAGVDTSCIQVKQGQRSAACFIAVDRQGQRMIFALGGAAFYDPDAVSERCQLDAVNILYIGDAHGEATVKVFARLGSSAKVIFSPGGWMISHGGDTLRLILARSDVLIVSRREAETLSGNQDPEPACQALAARGPRAVALTLGERGALVYDGQMEWVPAIPVENVVDTTGAGDAFSAGLITGLLESKTLAQAARLGCAVAAQKIAHFGSRSGLPDREQMRAWL